MDRLQKQGSDPQRVMKTANAARRRQSVEPLPLPQPRVE